MKKLKDVCIGIGIGCINSLLGTGGGLLAVPLLKQDGCSQKEAQANALAILFPITIISVIIYAKKQYVNFFACFPLLFPAVLGAILGSIFFKKIPSAVFSKIFAGMMLYAGGRMLYSVWMS